MDSSIEKTLNALAILQSPAILREFFRSRAFSARCFRLVQALRCHQPALGTILDVGANIGQFALAAHFHFPDSQIHSFEPLPDLYPELVENSRRIKNVQCFNCALGESTGQMNFYRNHYSRLSSSLPIDAANDHPRYRERKTSCLTVDVFRLEELSERWSVTGPVLLKMDVQGMEREVLQGSGTFLSRVDFVLCEMALIRLYQGQPLFDTMHELLKGFGYRLVAPLYLNRGKGGIVIEMDALYAREC